MYEIFINNLNNWLYTYILIVLLIGTGIYFTVKTKFVQFRLLKESLKVVTEEKEDEGSISSFEALMVSTASRVGVGNIAGVSTAITMGGPGAVFWMWVIALLGSATAFIESTLAQVYKVRDKDGSSFGGPAYYIETALKSRTLGVLFATMLILTYMGGFNMVASFNIASAFEGYNFYTDSTPMIVGIILAIVVALCIFGGGKRVSKITGIIVPIMAISYILVSLVIVFSNLNLVPKMFSDIFSNAFDLKAAFGGFTGSAIMYGIKRGLYSNEAGVGSAPNAAAAASVSHPVKQGLVQMLSVFIDTMVLCSATAFMLLASGIAPDPSLRGVPYVQLAIATKFGDFGIWFITFALFCFAFTSILGNFYYAEANLKYLNKTTPEKNTLLIFRIIAVIIVFFGAQLNFAVAWDTADVLMGAMALINIPIIVVLGNISIKCLDDYTKQKSEGKNPVFKVETIGIKEKVDFWNELYKENKV
ncbi:alanine or glycine:cation symporter, AGCS family [Anaerovirgula multivorans]|uniref:Alanine or glycine:cation symporter, AGCS family n=1 Tax=Anaerovirgula multivorans TaxID=312168 RepID=A0A239HL35_9FIRM|nr:alanine/glycine:cation symporter family protein [Anaerovirgula multivorans]SNS81808.1 alanine or glycine:cation symporter, AGCS family [Anaerovirgula multivorans]